MPSGVHTSLRGAAARAGGKLPEGAATTSLIITKREKLMIDAVLRLERRRKLNAGDYLSLLQLWQAIGESDVMSVCAAAQAAAESRP